MHPSALQMQAYPHTNGAAPQRPTSQPPPTNANVKPAGPPPKPLHNGCADVKPRLTKEQHDVLETHFQQHSKPTTAVKKNFAEALGVPLDKINNWFQNRRAKVKQDAKKHANQLSMSMGIFAPNQIPQRMPIVNSQYPLHTEQPQPQLPIAQDYYPVRADISPPNLPVQSMEGPSALDQMALQQPFDMHQSLRSIPEADRATQYNHAAVMQSIMAAANGPSYMQNHAASLPQQDPGFSYDTANLSNGLPNGVPADMTFTMPPTLPEVPSSEGFSFTFGGVDYSALGAPQPDAHNGTASLSPAPSPFSGAQAAETPQSANGQNTSSVASIASVYTNWNENQNNGPDITPNGGEDYFDPPYDMPQASVSEQALPFWGANEQGQGFPQEELYQHPNVSAHAIRASPEQANLRKLSTGPADFESPATFGDDAFTRRNSSTTNLAHNIEAVHIQSSSSEDFKEPTQSSSIAARRHKRPTALNPSTLRSASYSNAPSSPGSNSDHTLRRIRSSGLPNAGGRVQKNPGSAQRSPMTLTFADAAASPKFARTFSASSTAGQGGSLAPPTPLTPNEMGRFPYWQSNTVIRTHPAMPEHSSPESLNVNWSAEPQSAGLFSVNGSPPSTPFDLAQANQTRLGADSLYRDTPPQSAPATQQTFPRTALMQPPQIRAGFHSTTDLTIQQPKPSHFRRPSLPETAHGQVDDAKMQYPVQFGSHFNYEDYSDVSLSGITHNVPFAPPVSAMPDFLVHEYNPPHGGPHAALLRRTTEPQPKNYIFANQGPHDFRT